MRFRFLIVWLLATLIVRGQVTEADSPEVQRNREANARLSALELAWQDHVKAWREEQVKAFEAAKASGDAIPAMRMSPPLGDFVARYQAAAMAYAGTDDAIPFLQWIAGQAFDQSAVDAATDAIQTIMEHHHRSPKLADFPVVLGRLNGVLGKTKVAEYLALIERDNPNGDTRAHAIIARVGRALSKAPLDSKDYQSARAEALRAKGLARDEGLQARIQGQVDERERLAVGAEAPDIEGVDLDGVAFKLSDYKGKVVLLDFWGDW
ncbi:MAG: redoxin domain-containing protein [Planctomycetes bacterium]|nr:redoxin domain-containing protein [Planctomycetota bacterium]